LSLVDNVQLLRQSAEDARQDAKQWAAMSGEIDSTREAIESGVADDGEDSRGTYRSDDIGNATRLVDVLRSTIGNQQITAGSKEILAMVQKLNRFETTALCSTDELRAMRISEGGERKLNVPGQPFSGAEIPRQEDLKHIKSQQKSLSKEREEMIQGIQRLAEVNTTAHSAAVYSLLSGFGEQSVHVTAADSEILGQGTKPSVEVRLGTSTSCPGTCRGTRMPWNEERSESALERGTK